MGDDQREADGVKIGDPAEERTIDVMVTPLAPDAPTPRLDRGSQLGRYVVLDFAGEGGMGIVYKAYDPELDRTVALKLIQISVTSGPWDTHARTRLLREARAMARLSHPNVVAVHDVGIVEQEIFVAMEFVAGPTLDGWLRAGPPSRAEILAAFIGAGRGLAAAHAANMVHRDFKPANVVMGDDGRARVLDFGVAQVAAQADAIVAADSARAPGAAPAPHSLGVATVAGNVTGTPRYMAPEQLRGAATDGRTDQFAFCVALFEALAGVHPFAGETQEELRNNVLSGRRAEPARAADIPRPLRPILARGMALLPDQRYPSMNALLADLEAQPRLARRRRWLVAAAVAGIAVVGAGLYVVRARSTVCLGAADHVAGIWDSARRDAVDRAFAASGHAAPADVGARLAGVIDGYAGGWIAMRTDACQATRLRGEQSETLLDLRMACLDRRLNKLDAMVRQLTSGPDAALVDKSVEIAHALPDLRPCADTAALLERLPPPQAAQRSVEMLRRRLDDAEAQLDAGRLKEGVAAASAIVADAEALGYAPVLGEALHVLGRLQIEAGAYAESEATLERALRATSASHNDALVAEILTRLAYTAGCKQSKYPVGLAYGLAAESAIARSGNDERLRARLLEALATIHFRKGDVAQTRAAATEALALRQELDGPEHPGLAAPLNSLGNSYSYEGKPAEAHPYFERALAVRERAFGPEHPSLATALDSLGLNAFALGRYAEARRLAERAAAIIEARLGADNVRLAGILHNLANVFIEEGEAERALESFVRATRLEEAAHGSDNPRVAVSITGQGDALQALGRYTEAVQRYERGIDIFTSKLGAEHFFVGFGKMGLGRCQLELGQTRAALVTLTSALNIMQAGRQDATTLAQIRFPLARALSALGREPTRALTLAREAQSAFRESGAASADELAEVEKWLAERNAL